MIEILAAGLTLYLFVSGLLSGSFLIFGTVLYASVIFYALSFLLSSFLLKRHGMGFERVFIAAASMVSGIWLYEVVYHYFYYYDTPLTILSLASNDIHFLAMGGNGITFPLLWALILVSLPLSAYKHMRFGLPQLGFAAICFGIFLVWAYSGYPQFIAPQWYAGNPRMITIIPSGEENNLEVVQFYGYIFNSISKVLCLLPSFLFLDIKAFSRRGRTRLSENLHLRGRGNPNSQEFEHH